MTLPDAGGRRLIGAANTLSLPEMGRVLAEAFPDYGRKIPTRVLPGALVRILAVFDRALKAVVPNVGVVPVAEAACVTDLTGVRFRRAEEAVRAAGRSLIDYGVV